MQARASSSSLPEPQQAHAEQQRSNGARSGAAGAQQVGGAEQAFVELEGSPNPVLVRQRAQGSAGRQSLLSSPPACTWQCALTQQTIAASVSVL